MIYYGFIGMRRCTGPVRKTRRWCNKCITVHVIWWYSWFFIFHEVINKGWNNWTKEHPNSYISKYFFDFFVSPKIQRENFLENPNFFLSSFIERISWDLQWTLTLVVQVGDRRHGTRSFGRSSPKHGKHRTKLCNSSFQSYRSTKLEF